MVMLSLLMFLYKIIEEKSHLTSEKSNFELCPEATIHHFRFPLVLNKCVIPWTEYTCHIDYVLHQKPNKKEVFPFVFGIWSKRAWRTGNYVILDTGCTTIS